MTLPTWSSAFLAIQGMCTWAMIVAGSQSYLETLSTLPPPHMWPILSMPLKLRCSADQSSFSMTLTAASATQSSPPRLVSYGPGTMRPSSG